MKAFVHVLGAALSIIPLTAQISLPDPFTFDALIKGLANPRYASVADLIGEIQNRGIGFELDEKQLASILTAASAGKREPTETAALIMTCLRACEKCRARAFEPMEIKEMMTLRRWGFTPGAIVREARTRGTKDLQNNEGSAELLRSAGISEEGIKVLMPEDRRAITPIDGYKAFALNYAEQYDVTASEGFLRVTAELSPNSQSEFIFKHNALFVKALKGSDPVDFGSYFSKPTPRDTSIEAITYKFGLEDTDEKSGRPAARGKKKEIQPPIEVTKIKDGDLCGFRIVLTNGEARGRRFSFFVRWREPTAPKG